MTRALKVLVVGSGGREHALCLRLLGSESVSEVVCTPGNPGMTVLPLDLRHKSLRVAAGDALEMVRVEAPDLVVIGPEIPLCEGLADEVRALGVLCYGPSRAAAALEGSKAFMKAFCHRHEIRTAREVVVDRLDALDPALAQFSTPPVVKADGLCAGKGVVVAESFEEARQAASFMLSGEAFGVAGSRVVLEERLIGQEASVHAICDGKRALVLPVAQDHKRIFDGDQGPNTGGMGTYAPAPVVTPALLEVIEREVIERVLEGMVSEGTPFVGTLFVGLMVSPEGVPSVLEFNVRFGDPETQVLTMVTDGDFADALLCAAKGNLEEASLRVSRDYAVCVVLAAEGYPEAPSKGDPITGLERAEALAGVRVFHAGTLLRDGRLLTNGGRVLGVTARASTLRDAQALAYRAATLIEFRGKQMRSDIAHRALTPDPS